MDCVRGGGQVLIIGLHEEKVLLDAFALLLREIDVKGVLASYNEFKDIIDMLDQKKINADLFISDVISGKDLVEKGFEPLVASRDLIKILVKMEELS
jgi:(R,R)-butanediol dehydrogenase/meso-butanediol dehydrogenase/diacetyl reductase